MADDPKTRPEDEDKWGVGQLDDGTIQSFTQEEAARLKGERDAEEDAFDDDDFSDIDDPIPEE